MHNLKNYHFLNNNEHSWMNTIYILSFFKESLKQNDDNYEKISNFRKNLLWNLIETVSFYLFLKEKSVIKVGWAFLEPWREPLIIIYFLFPLCLKSSY